MSKDTMGFYATLTTDGDVTITTDGDVTITLPINTEAEFLAEITRLRAELEELRLTYNATSEELEHALKRAEEAEAERDRLWEALDTLQRSEAAYRRAHDVHGDGALAAGRAWDIMRRAGDKARGVLFPLGGEQARSALAPKPTENEKFPEEVGA